MLKHYDSDQINSLAYTGSLLKGTAHNINTPLSSILGRADIVRLRLDRLTTRIADPELLQEFAKFQRDISLIIENTNRLSSLVKSAVYRCVTAVQNERVPVNIAGVLRDDLEFLMSDMDFKHNIEKKFSIDIAVPPLIGAPVHFSNSFIEILDNARTAMQDTSEKILSVTVNSDGARIVVVFCDNGCGMDEITRQAAVRLFEHPPESVGTVALHGLAYAAWLLKPYRPCLHIDSKPGQTTVRLEFPV